MESQEQIEKWKTFAKEKLIPDLEAQRKVVDQLEKDIENYSNLSRWASGVVAASSASSPSPKASGSKEVLVDLGLGYYSPAEICNLRDTKILVTVGLGFQLEMNLAEAAMFADQKVIALRKEHEIAVRTLAGISSTLATIVYGISQLN